MLSVGEVFRCFLSQIRIRAIFRTFLGHGWDTFGTHLGHAWNMLEALWHAVGMFETCIGSCEDKFKHEFESTPRYMYKHTHQTLVEHSLESIMSNICKQAYRLLMTIHYKLLTTYKSEAEQPTEHAINVLHVWLALNRQL